MKNIKIALVCSSGGHLLQLLLLKDWWVKYNRFWVTFNKQDAIDSLRQEKTYWCRFPTNRNLINLIRNTFLAYKILKKEKPKIIISTGAAIAVSFFFLSKFFKAKTVFIEVYDRIREPTLTGKIVYHVTDFFFLQWAAQKKFYPKGYVIGELL